MGKLLKGNYKVKKSGAGQKRIRKDSHSKFFEEEALKKLGGSIAFVMKGDKFTWEG